MTKPLPGTLFDPATHFEVGDLIYGINKERFWMSQLISEHLNRNDELVSADHLNNQFLGTGVSGAGKNYGQGTSGSQGHKAAATAYKEWLEKRVTHQGTKTTLTQEMMSIDEGHIDDLYDAPQRFHRICRSCKAGIAYATLEMKKKVHFIINGIDMRKTVNKPEEAQNWITAKELRSVFRKWNDNNYKNGVLFWKNEFTKLSAPVPDGKGGTTQWDRKIVAVKAPWEEDSAVWRIYKPKDPSAFRLLDPNAPAYVPTIKKLDPNAPAYVPAKKKLDPNAPPFIPKSS